MVDGREIMKQCIEYAKQSFYIPRVGAIILDADGNQVGFGCRQRVLADSPGVDVQLKQRHIPLKRGVCSTYHAEQMAILQAGERAIDGTLYCTLEPCVSRLIHAPQQVSPPCTTLIYNAGIRRVVIGMFDNNVDLYGKAVAVLQRYGIEVVQNAFGLEGQLQRLMVNYAASGRTFRGENIGRVMGGIKLGNRKLRQMQANARADRSVADIKRETRMEPYIRSKSKRTDWIEDEY